MPDNWTRHQTTSSSRKRPKNTNSTAWLWSTDVKNELLSLGFRQSDADEAVFISEDGNGITIVAVYVDDILVISDTTCSNFPIPCVVSEITKKSST
jgi:hypothetical protein